MRQGGVARRDRANILRGPPHQLVAVFSGKDLLRLVRLPVREHPHLHGAIVAVTELGPHPIRNVVMNPEQRVDILGLYGAGELVIEVVLAALPGLVQHAVRQPGVVFHKQPRLVLHLVDVQQLLAGAVVEGLVADLVRRLRLLGLGLGVDPLHVLRRLIGARQPLLADHLVLGVDRGQVFLLEPRLLFRVGHVGVERLCLIAQHVLGVVRRLLLLHRGGRPAGGLGLLFDRGPRLLQALLVLVGLIRLAQALDQLVKVEVRVFVTGDLRADQPWPADVRRHDDL